MSHVIKCDRQQSGWGFNVCLNCKNFRSGTNIKNRWRCSLNTNLPERKAFHTVWLEENAIGAGIMQEKHRGEIVVNYIGKNKGGGGQYE